MSRATLMLLVLLGLPTAGVALLPDGASSSGGGGGLASLRPGMSPGQVRAALGTPTRVSREVILFRAREQWHYTSPPLRLTFLCPRGAPPSLVLPAPPALPSP